MASVEDFLTAQEEQEIIDTIVAAENKTSGELRVHIESTATIDHYQRAAELFHLLKMDLTKAENGVLIYVAVSDRKFSICGGKGINEVVPKDFWEETKNAIQTQFKAGNFKDGIITGIHTAGEALSQHFPWHHGDTNELSNELSKG